MNSYTLQILHASDMEGGGGDLRNAPAFVSIVDYLEDQAENSLFLSSGDLVLPGPFMSAAGDSSLRTAIQQANEAMLGLEPGTLSNLREGAGSYCQIWCMGIRPRSCLIDPVLVRRP